MKTIEEINREIELIVTTTKEGKKPKIETQLEVIKLLKFLSVEELNRERQKLIEEKKKIESTFETYLANFTMFRIKDDFLHRRKVKAEFNKVFEISKLNKRIATLNYLFN